MNSTAAAAATAGPVYHDFEPPHKMIREPTTHTLSVDLSDDSTAGKSFYGTCIIFFFFIFLCVQEYYDMFYAWHNYNYKKENIKVQLVHSRRLLVVSGKCPLGDGNRWSRFRLEFPVPDGCDVKAIHARFDNGVVRVTMPGREQEQEPALAPAKTPGAVGDQQAGAVANSPPPPPPVAAPLRGGRRLLQERGKLATTLVGVVLVLFSFFIYVRYSLKP
ncbi:hypothetical protein ABZP36_012732 [Zizania latifolia]